VFALEPFLDVFVLGIFPEALLDHVVGGHVVLPAAFGPALYAKPRFPLFPWGAWSVASAPEGPSRIVGMISGVLVLPWCEAARGLGKKHRAFRLVLTVAWRRGAEQLAA
jgi:hypothetical protein